MFKETDLKKLEEMGFKVNEPIKFKKNEKNKNQERKQDEGLKSRGKLSGK